MVRALRIEHLFRLFSLAVLGLIALACVPTPKPQDVKEIPETIEISADLELEAVKEVEIINAGEYQPFHAGLVTPASE